MLHVHGRVPHFAKEIRRFVRFLNKQYPLKKEINLYVVPDAELTEEKTFDLDEHDDCKPYYGAYYYDKGIILLATGMFYPEFAATVLTILAHEFYHAMQKEKKVSFDERQPDCFAVDTVISYVRQVRGNLK